MVLVGISVLPKWGLRAVGMSNDHVPDCCFFCSSPPGSGIAQVILMRASPVEEAKAQSVTLLGAAMRSWR